MKDYLKVGISGVRGIAGETFTPQLAAAFAHAFGSYGGRGSVLVGRDTRASGEMFEQAVIAGLQSAGCQPILAGIVPTPSLLMLTRKLGARGGIAITASHNPAPWNALKFVDSSGLFLSPSRATEFFDVYHQGEFKMVPENEIPGATLLTDPMAWHREKIFAYVDVEAIRRARFKVAVDCCNGVGALHSRPFLEALGCEVVTCGDRITGDFDREPEPLPGNLGTLGQLVSDAHCVIGFAQDPDGDRLALVNEFGKPIGEDLTVAFGVRQVLDHHARGPVVVHMSTSRCVRAVAEQRGVPFHLARIGEINVTEKMLSVGSVVGGEGNGGIIIPAIHPCRDSFTGMAIVLELLALSGKTVSQLRAETPTYYMVKDKIPIRNEAAVGILRAIRRRYEHEEISLLDGVHVDLKDRWFHARMSNTEPVMRLTSEAPDEASARALVAELKAEVERATALA
ncbi:MAG: phosphoglucosamine mutase [Lentisphaerae bacterium]|nr:phosphoglucosamine mutase [Lentisphaerota bacterium]